MDFGPIVIVVVLLALPVLILMTGAIAAGILGRLVEDDVAAENEGTELAELWG